MNGVTPANTLFSITPACAGNSAKRTAASAFTESVSADAAPPTRFARTGRLKVRTMSANGPHLSLTPPKTENPEHFSCGSNFWKGNQRKNPLPVGEGLKGIFPLPFTLFVVFRSESIPIVEMLEMDAIRERWRPFNRLRRDCLCDNHLCCSMSDNHINLWFLHILRSQDLGHALSIL